MDQLNTAGVPMFRVLTVLDSGEVHVVHGDVHVRRPRSGEVCWVDLTRQDADSLAVLAREFQFHPLTLEDCLHFDQRPKLESYEDHLFLVLHGFHIDWEELARSEPIELHMFLSERLIVTVHERNIESLDSLFNRIQQDGHLVAGHHADHLCYLISDGLIDSYFPLLDELQVRLDHLEDCVLQPNISVELSEILRFKRLLLDLRRILSPQREVLGLLARKCDRLITERTALYFRDVYDHAIRLFESVESARELVGNVRDAHLWDTSQKTNEIVKRLTILSAIFLPLTFITGFFGQNFEHLPFESRGLMWGMLASCIAVPVGMLIYFIRSRWF